MYMKMCEEAFSKYRFSKLIKMKLSFFYFGKKKDKVQANASIKVFS